MNPPQHKTDIAMMGTAAPSVSRPTRTSAHLPYLSSQASQMPRGKPIAKTTPAPIPLVPPPQSDFMQFQSSPLISGGITSQAPSPPTLGPHPGIETSGVPLSAMSYNALTSARTYLSSAISHGILPPSSPPTLLLSSSTEDPQPSKAAEAAPAIAPAIVSPLQEPSNIYNLSQSSLECLIGDVVREDGFIKLLEQVSSMWRIRNLVPTDRRT
ncbi:hypothetical protein BD779DRAFT_976132 [Infundibulicybe gibba]|nr:hypothetical protein BD779DRAFT_976132 [Infundibulicybe gibba]